ncbi:hypothetical protein TIFTF001_011289 [Ficus carica]|uniref:Uncharacterized protein n=1 Tax=Ficus carica TaxID=3494 RepID=A0AA88AA72_FICCA|nr:hypothetical protein TIFTF001_011289 [Ficus carica]
MPPYGQRRVVVIDERVRFRWAHRGFRLPIGWARVRVRIRAGQSRRPKLVIRRLPWGLCRLRASSFGSGARLSWAVFLGRR